MQENIIPDPKPMIDQAKFLINKFLQQKSSTGILLMLSAALALIIANTPLSVYYDLLISTEVAIKVGALEIAKPLLLWINDGLMAIFFLLIGLELKREFLVGELNELRKISLPAFGAVGGMAMPALVYLFFNAGDDYTARGWAIPAATDIAFAMGILLLLGSRVPKSLKVFLISLAIFDDIGAIAIIALFYTENISTVPLLVVAASLVVLLLMNRSGVNGIAVYLLLGAVMWVAMLKSGVHATLAGVLLAMFIPLRSKHRDDDMPSPLLALESDLHNMVSYAILPIFAFANAGVDLRGVGMDELLHPVPVGVALGLLLGKQVGVFSMCWIGVRTGLASLPAGMSWKGLYGVAALSGVGFTMSLFIGSLAFQETVANRIFDERVGIIAGSLAAGLLGYFVVKWSLKSTPQQAEHLPQSSQ